MKHSLMYVKLHKKHKSSEYIALKEDIRIVCTTLRQEGGNVYIDKYSKDESYQKLTEEELHKEKLDENGRSLEEASYYLQVDLSDSDMTIRHFNEFIQKWDGSYLD